jgi:hypothetical protein
MNLKNSTFSFDYSILKVENYNAYTLTKISCRFFLKCPRLYHINYLLLYYIIYLVCSDFDDGRIAVLAIGSHPVYLHLHAIAESLHIPYISIKWESLSEENSIINSLASHAGEITEINQINIHPPAHSLMNAIIDLIFHYKWEFVTVLFQETMGLGRIEDLIKIYKTKRGSLSDIRIQVNFCFIIFSCSFIYSKINVNR